MSSIAKDYVYPGSLERIDPQSGQESVWDYPRPPSYQIAWSYADPLPEATVIKDHIAFYAHVVEATIDGKKAEPPVWKWIGGWVTANIVGPFMTQDDNPDPQAKMSQEIES